MANKKNSSTFEIDDFNIANVAIAANGGEKAIETVKKETPSKDPETKAVKVKNVSEKPSNRSELPKDFKTSSSTIFSAMTVHLIRVVLSTSRLISLINFKS